MKKEELHGDVQEREGGDTGGDAAVPILMSLSEYEEIKGRVRSRADAFRAGQMAAIAYMADCIGTSLVFHGFDGVVRRIESGRRLAERRRRRGRNGGKGNGND